MRYRCSSHRLPEGAATLLEAMTHDPSNKLRMSNKTNGTGLQERKHGSTKSMRWVSIVTLNTKVKAMDSSSNNNNKLRRFNESAVTVNLTRNESKRQYKQQVCTDEMIQRRESVGLHEHNNDEQKMNNEKDTR